LALERRLLLSYLAAFSAIFLVAAVAVRFAFVAILDQQTDTRLQDIARAGLRSVLYSDDSLAIDKTEISNAALLTREQGLQWFDERGRLLGAEGLVPEADSAVVEGRRQLSVGQRTFNTVTIPIVNPQKHQRVGMVRASEWNEQELADVRYLDTGLLIGTLLAVLGSAVGGRALVHRAVGPVAQSFQTLREFTADAAHELRGPLTAIAATADGALRDTERDPVHDRSRFEAIGDGVKQMSRLTSDLLLLAGADRSLERELFVVDLAVILKKLVDRYRPQFSAAGVGLDIATDKTAIVYGNPDQIERILANLLENALRYTPRGGRVSVEDERTRSETLIVVRDSGIGIAAEHLERIFDRFWRVDVARSQGGSGLGLAIARALARRHGGDVTVESRLGTGSEFVASFPVRPARVD
jgi:OmpR-family two-component system manganese-sensing sensor histidine kinase